MYKAHKNTQPENKNLELKPERNLFPKRAKNEQNQDSRSAKMGRAITVGRSCALCVSVTICRRIFANFYYLPRELLYSDLRDRKEASARTPPRRERPWAGPAAGRGSSVFFFFSAFLFFQKKFMI